MRIYLDTCAIQRPLDGRDQHRLRLEAEAVLAVVAAVETGAVDLISSDVLRFEAANNPRAARRDFAAEVLALARYDMPMSPDVEARARAYVGGGIKSLDALHLACAVTAGADLFCTTDDAFLRRARLVNTGLTRIVTPGELAALLP